MVRGKSQPQNKPRASSTPYVERSSVARALDFSQISVSTASISSISLPSLDVSSTVESIPSNYEENVNLILKTPFKRVCQEIARNLGNFRISQLAIDALQLVTEEYLVELFHYADKCAKHAKRKTISLEDLQLAQYFSNLRINSEH